MVDSKNKEFNDIVTKFIQKNYVVSRIKYNMRFKRAIILDDGQAHLLKNEPTTRAIKNKLTHSIQLIFGCSKPDAEALISKALNI